MIIDSAVWIALKYVRDKYHKQAKVKFRKIMANETKLFVTDYIIIETYSFLLRKTSHEIAQETLNMFMRSKLVTILYNDSSTFSNTKKICEKYKQLSYVDANIILSLYNYGISELFTYDRGFDGIKAIKRIS